MLIELILAILIAWVIYDRYVQRQHQLLINYPVIGRMRYFLEALREPFRQYFADEKFYESKDKVDWVYNAAYDEVGYISFSPNQPQPNPKFLLKHANAPLNSDEVESEFNVTFGAKREKPYVAKTVIGRSAMSDGAISPEGTRAFTKGAYLGAFPINTGEGSLTTNFFFTHKSLNEPYMDSIEIKNMDQVIFKTLKTIFNGFIAIKVLRNKLIPKTEEDTYIFDEKDSVFFRPNWSAPLDVFPKEVPEDMADIVFQMGSGLYGVRDKEGKFDAERYQKVMRFCRMTEIKLAQGAKQTGGKLAAEKVSDSIAFFRGVEAHQPLISPNRFPYASSIPELFDFVGELQKLSEKPVGIKIIISSRENMEPFAKEMKRRIDENIAGNPDFITIDGGDGGSATSPLFLMDRVGFHIKDALVIADEILKEYGVRDEVKIIASGKVLTPDDVAITLALGADFVNIARGFMMSAGCIRARMCSGHGSHQCPVGLATQDKTLRSSYLVLKHAVKVQKYHENLLKGLKTIMAIMGINRVEEINKEHLTFVDKNGFIYENVNRYLDTKLKPKV